MAADKLFFGIKENTGNVWLAADGHEALELYRGPFLPGFFVADAPEFERWMEEERARLRARACSRRT